jgi:metallophosphoesterase (TIGR00282 family)
MERMAMQASLQRAEWAELGIAIFRQPPKSENRRPKAERRPNSEARITHRSGPLAGRRGREPCSDFGLRPSFGSRVSDFNPPTVGPARMHTRWVKRNRTSMMPEAWAKRLARGRRGITVEGVKLLFIADIVGQPGRRAVKDLVPSLRRRHGLNLVVANGENAAGGSGITVNTAEDLFAFGVDIITTGDHLWDQKEVMELLDGERRFLRPLNYPPGTPGQGSVILQRPGIPPVAVLNLQGRTFMPTLENPFHAALAEVERLRHTTEIIFVDFHAEATSEKVAMARMLDGRVSAVVGTHTHVQTADEQIFPGGTAFLCDGGFTGPHESVIGREIEPIVRRFMTNMPQKFEVAKGRVLLQGALIEIDEQTGRAKSIQRVSESLEPPF